MNYSISNKYSIVKSAILHPSEMQCSRRMKDKIKITKESLSKVQVPQDCP